MKILQMTKSRNRKKLIAVLLIVSLFILAALAYYLVGAKNSLNQSDSSVRPVNSVDYGGPTDEEQAAGEVQKEANKQREALDTAPASSVADILISDASQYGDTVEVRAYIPNIYEDSGTCTAKFTKNSQEVSVSSKAFKDAKTTQCGALDLDRQSFSEAGEWKLVIAYKSPAANGTTQPKTVTIK